MLHQECAKFVISPYSYEKICLALVSAHCYLCVLERTVSCKSKLLSIGLDLLL